MSFSDLLPQNFLLMIENSSALAAFWSDLRDCYLPRLVEQLSGSHPTHLNNIFIAESRPNPDEFRNSIAKHCSSLEAGLSELHFNYDPDNRLSVTQIQNGIKFLSSSPATQSRHLIIVAATTPLEFVDGYPTYDPWNELAKILAKEKVFLHLALTADLRSGRLTNLFEQTVKWQQHTEEPLWLPKYSTALIFRVSAPKYADALDPGPVQMSSEARAEQSMRAPRALRDVIPSDIYTTKSLDDMSSESPSLVSQLQQVHGLTKKKVYGAKPARVPFILDSERVRERYRNAPNHSPISLSLASEASAPPSLSRGRRSRGNLKADRSFSARSGRGVEPHQSQWQQQPMPSPEGGSPYSSSSLSSPSSPVAQISPLQSQQFGLDSSGADPVLNSMVPEDLDLLWASGDPAHSQLYIQGFIPGNEDAYFPDPQAASSHTQSFHGMPMTPPNMSGASTSPRFPMPPLGSPVYLPHAPSADYAAVDFQSNLLTRHPRAAVDAPPSLSSIVALPTHTHTRTHMMPIHAPAPSRSSTAAPYLPADADDSDLLVSAPALRRDPSIRPPIAAPAPQQEYEYERPRDRGNRAARYFVTASAASASLESEMQQSMPPPHANAPRRATSTSSSAHASSSSSSSLTGWAG
ncbi:hypothetical protein B0H16DRAFT_284605 [Mycena metata]|uniref:Uncharacterized protein n=1 Tax=Mycena metata TaxID=1033252 RepID=A0AAD7H4U2_9AGAR|nr:hypothetical protein B0H16DRAFT_584918 [Mycena metata]KAJ7725212.1 hypothetical protein B0H16DRAFT_284605 [Mycena metata]